MAVEELRASQAPSRRRVRTALLRHPVTPVIGLWVVAAIGLSQVTERVTDWFDMTDEMRYERLAISIARSGSPLPSIHGTSVRDLDQLYPLLIAPLFRHGTVFHDLRQAHILGAWMMSSACIPAFLLARRVSGRAWVGWVIAVGSLTIPWLIYSSFLLTETIAYPVFLWSVLAVQRTVAVPSARADLAAILAVVLAFLARTELLALAAVLPLAVLLAELSTASPGPWRQRTAAALRRSLLTHRLLVVVYGLVAVSALGFVVSGGSVLGLSAYGQSVPGALVPGGFAQAVFGNVAQLSFGLGLLPFVVGFAWLLANAAAPAERREVHVFACVGSLSLALVTLEVTKYAFGVGNVIYERFLFYFVPILLLAFVCAVLDRNWPRWSLLVPLVVVCAGFALRPQAAFTWRGGRLNPDTPVSIFYHPLLEVTGSKAAMQALLVVAAVGLTGVFVLAATRIANRRRLGTILVALAAGLLVAETGYVFVRLFRVNGYSNRPLTSAVSPALGWVDSAVGEHADVSVVPYHVSTDYWVSLTYWRDIEFWNKSVDRDAQYSAPALYDYTGIWFPKLTLTFDPSSGNANVSPTRLVVQSVTDTRFQIAGNVQAQTQEANLIDADMPWRLAFLTLGAYDDGWLKPDVPATIRLFSSPGQRGPRIHYLTLQIWAPDEVASRPFAVRSNLGLHRGVASNSGTTFVNAFPVCVPAAGHADVVVSAAGSSTIPGDLSTLDGSLGQRMGSIFLADASVSDDLGGRCSPAGS